MRFRPLAAMAAWALAQLAPSSTLACRGVDLLPEIGMISPANLETILAAAHDTSNRYGRLFEVTRAGARSYVFATLHLPDERISAVPQRVAAALRESRTLLLELSDRERVEGFRAALRTGALEASPGRTAAALLPPDQMAALEDVASARGVKPATLGRLSAGVIALMLENPGCVAPGTDKSFLDKQLGQLAAGFRLEVVGLERFEEQIASVTQGFSAELERDLLIAAVRHAERGLDVAETTVQAYQKGDLGLLVSWMRSSQPIPGRPDSALPASILDELIDGRSRRMVDRALPYLAAGNAFVAVGAAHLPSARGILASLSDAGFKIRRID